MPSPGKISNYRIIVPSQNQPNCNRNCFLMYTHVEPPGDLVRPWVCPDVALEVHVVALLDVGAVEGGAQAQDRLGDV